ncbi:PAAR domain-containing protein [Vibrio brasiliensis]
MSAHAGGRGLIHKGDRTTTGGVVTQGLGNIIFVGEGATQIDMIATCPRCDKGWGKIVPIEKLDVYIDNVQAALDGDFVVCGCPEGTNTLISSAGAMKFSKVDGQIRGFKPHASTQEMNATFQTIVDSLAGEGSGAALSNPASRQGAQESKSQPEDVKAIRLKSPLLKQSLTLDKLANRDSHSYKIGSHGQEVEYIQQALIKLNFDLGNTGADGDFGPTTKRQVELFQNEYQETSNTHLAYQIGAVDGIVGQGTLLGLDEALVEGWEYQRSIDSVVVTYKEDLPADKRVVSQKAIEIIRLAFSRAGAKHAVITSTLRTPDEQARVMYRNAKQDLDSQFKLYGRAGDKVLTVYKENHNATNVIDLMAKKIESLLRNGEKVSKHCTTFDEYEKVNIIDLGVNSMLKLNNHDKSLINKISNQFIIMKHQGKLRFIDETNKSNRCWHIEVDV